MAQILKVFLYPPPPLEKRKFCEDYWIHNTKNNYFVNGKYKLVKIIF